MLARIAAGIYGNGVKTPHLFSLRFLLHSSTNANYLVDILVNSLGVSTQEAAKASSKVTRLTPSKNPKLVINFFRKRGFDNTQIKNIVTKYPRLLFSNIDKTLKPKFEFFQEYGLSGAELVNFFVKHDHVFHRGVVTSLRPSLNYFRNLLGSDEDVVKAFQRRPWLLSCNAPKIVAPNVSLFQDIGFSDENIRKFILVNPRVFTYKRERLEDIIHQVENDLGIPRQSAMFFYGVNAIIALSQSALANKFEIYRSFGWPDAHIRTMVRKLPFGLSLQDANISKKLTFLMKEAGCTSEYLASHPALLLYSLEKRLIPRYKVLKILHDKDLKRSIGFYTAINMKPSRFMKEMMLPYKDKLPILFESYMKSVR